MSAKEYQSLLALIEQRNAVEPLLPVLRRGHNPANEMYIRFAEKRLPAPELERAPQEADETLQNLWRDRTRLFGEMNKQSNVFHSCRTDAERAENSRKVLAWWSDILAVKAKISHYEQHGEVPNEVDDGDELPDNAVALAKKLNSLRARISQTKARLRDLAGLDAGTPGKQAKIDLAEHDLKTLTHLSGLAQEKLKSYEQA
jgi:hypothetical protein